MARPQASIVPTALALGLLVLLGGCGFGTGMPPPNVEGMAVLELRVWTETYPGEMPGDAWSGWSAMPSDLNGGTEGPAIRLYYRMGRANGADGTPLAELYTVDETEGEALKARDDTWIDGDLNAGTSTGGHVIYLACRQDRWPVVRGIVVANVDPDDYTAQIAYAPPEVEGQYPVIWLKERRDTAWSPCPEGPWTCDAQDLNEGAGWWTDWVYIGYCVDQEVYDWLTGD